MQTWNAIAMYKDGSVTEESYASVDGEVWGLISTSSRQDPFASIGSIWEAAVEGEDEYSSTVAQTWYPSLEEAIRGNQVDFDAPPADNVFARVDADSDWKSYWKSNFEVAGYASPTGRAYYRPKLAGCMASV